ncbi:hypothetical protein [Nostoc sp.]|uniref:hypothetical protein n=1 Tax=Nostoc sp. TaxID=1180 RepID=UPI002FFD4B9B
MVVWVSITYAAEDLQTNQPMALKVLSLHRIKDWKILELFEREVKILAHLNSFCTLAIALRKIKFGLFLINKEKAWLVNEINAFAERHNYE